MPVWFENEAPSTSSSVGLVHHPARHGRAAAAEHARRQRVVVADLALGLERRDHRRAELLGECGHLRHVEAGAVADDHHRALRPAQQRQRVVADRLLRRARSSEAPTRAPAAAGLRRPRARAASAPRRGRSGGRRRAAAARSCTRAFISSTGSESRSTGWLHAATLPEGAREVDLLERPRPDHLGLHLPGEREAACGRPSRPIGRSAGWWRPDRRSSDTPPGDR